MNPCCPTVSAVSSGNTDNCSLFWSVWTLAPLMKCSQSMKYPHGFRLPSVSPCCHIVGSPVSRRPGDPDSCPWGKTIPSKVSSSVVGTVWHFNLIWTTPRCSKGVSTNWEVGTLSVAYLMWTLVAQWCSLQVSFLPQSPVLPGNSRIFSVVLWLAPVTCSSLRREQKRRKPVMPVPSFGAAQVSPSSEKRQVPVVTCIRACSPYTA